MDLSRIKLGFESFVTKARQWRTQDTTDSKPDGNSKLVPQSSISNSDQDPLQCDSDHATENASLPEHLQKSLSLIDDREREGEAVENEVAVKISNEEERGNEIGEDAKSEESIGDIKATENEEKAEYDWIGAAKHEKQDEYDWTGADEPEKRVEYDWIGTDEHENKGGYGWIGASEHENKGEYGWNGGYELENKGEYGWNGASEHENKGEYGWNGADKHENKGQYGWNGADEHGNRDGRSDNGSYYGSSDNNYARKYLFRVRPEVGDCAYYMRRGTCKFGSNCKFNHPVKRKNPVTKEKAKVAKEKVKEREDLPENPGQTECKLTKEKVKVAKEKVKEREDLPENPGLTECKVTKEKVKERDDLPENPGQTECKVTKEKVKIAKEKVTEREDLPENPGKTKCKVTKEKVKIAKEKVKEREDLPENPGQTECKYYLRTGGCKFGNACRYNHSRAKVTVVNQTEELNFLGLPIRPGEKECPYYMRNGSCKYGANCKFNHPDPTAAGGSDPASGYDNGGSQASVDPRSSPRTINETAPFAQVMFSPAQVVPPQSPEWNDFQAPLYPPERSIHPPPAYVITDPATETNAHTHHQEPQMLVMKTGDRKFKMNHKFHHPKNRISKSPPSALSDMGLPLRPDQKICSEYSLYGICKFGPACKFDHPIKQSSTVSSPDHRRSFGDSLTEGVDTMAGNGKGNANRTLHIYL